MSALAKSGNWLGLVTFKGNETKHVEQAQVAGDMRTQKVPGSIIFSRTGMQPIRLVTCLNTEHAGSQPLQAVGTNGTGSCR